MLCGGRKRNFCAETGKEITVRRHEKSNRHVEAGKRNCYAEAGELELFLGSRERKLSKIIVLRRRWLSQRKVPVVVGTKNSVENPLTC